MEIYYGRHRIGLATLFAFLLATSLAAQQHPSDNQDASGFKQIFDGKTLNGWDCDTDFWRVENGSIVGESQLNHQPKQNIFCVWKGGQPANFELRLQYRLTGVHDGNSGIQYRSIERPDIAKWVLQGYQADIDLKQMYTGQIYEERARGFLSLRGQLAHAIKDEKPAVLGSVGGNDELKSFIKPDDWNDVDIIARGNILIQLWNGHLMSELIDDDTSARKKEGEIGIQLHRLPNCAMKIEVRNIRLKTFLPRLVLEGEGPDHRLPSPKQ